MRKNKIPCTTQKQIGCNTNRCNTSGHNTSLKSTADQSSGKSFNMGAAIKCVDSNTIAVATDHIKWPSSMAKHR